MKILTCFISATAGTATVMGHDVFDDPVAVRQRIGYLPESAPLYTDMAVVEYLQFIAEVRGVAGDYVRGEGAEVDESIEGDYTSTAEHPDAVDPSERHGKYIRTEPPKPHPGKHEV